MTELPQAFLSQMAAQLKGEMAAFLRTYDEPYQRGLRVNPWKRPTLLPDDCGERVPWEENGHYLALTSTAGADVLHEAGAWYLQEPSAMLPAAVLNAQPGEHVLDLCAAPGGKSTQSGLRMGGQGVLVCNEPVWERAKILSQNIERMGIPKGFDFIQEEDIPQIITWALAEANPNYPVPVVYNAARCRKVIDTIRAKAAENPPAEAAKA